MLLRLFFISFFFLLNATSCFANDKVILQLRWDHQFQFAGYYAAKWQGYYDEAGLDVEIRPAVSSSGILSAVKEVGEQRAHFGIGAADVLKGVDEGYDLAVIACIFQHSAAGFYTREDTLVQAPVDFLKLKVARRVNDLIDIEFQALLKAEGIEPAKVKPFPHQPGVEHLISGAVDVVPGYSINIPYSAANAGYLVNEFRPIQYGIDFYGDSIFTHGQIVKDNPQLIERFKEASIKGWAYALENKKEMVEKISKTMQRHGVRDDIAKFNQFQSEQIDTLVTYPEVEIGHINDARWNRMNQYLLSLGIVSSTLDVEQFIFHPERMQIAQAEKTKKRLIYTVTASLLLLLASIAWLVTLRVTVKRKAQELSTTLESLKKSEKKYRDLIEMAQEGIWVIDKENNTSFVNSSMAKMLGYQAEEMLGRNLFDFMDQQGKEIAQNNIERRKQGIKEQHDFEWICKNGNRVYTTMETSPILDDNGEYVGAIAGVVDITTRRIKEKVQDAQLRLVEYSSQNSSKDLLVQFLDEAENLTESCIGFFHFFDAKHQQLTLSSWSSNTSKHMCQAGHSTHHYPLDKAGVWADAARQGRPVIHNNYEELTDKKGFPEGHAAILRELVVPVIRNDQIVAILGVGNKKDDYVEADVKIVQQLADLAWETVSRKLTEELLDKKDTLMRNIGDNYPHSYILIVEKDLTIGIILGQEAKNLELPQEEYIGMPIDSLYKQHLDYIKESYNRVFEGQNQLFELFINNQFYSFSCVPLKENGEIDRILVVVENITDKKQLETKLQQAQKMESIGTLAGGIAHDFNNILSSILGFTELAIDSAEEGTELEDDLQEVRKASIRAKDMINQILTFARQSEVQVKPIQFGNITREVLKLIRSSLPSSIEIQEDIASDSLMMGSETQIHQLLMNLCTNGAQSMEENGGVLSLSLQDVTMNENNTPRGLTAGDYLELKIADTGVGIPQNNIQAVFEPYFTTKPTGEGSGMGLAVVHGIVEGYGGTIHVDSQVNQGTTFTVYLPITKKRKANTLSKQEELPRGSESVLVVDDEAAIAKMAERTLTQLGYKVTTRTSSLEALELFTKKPEAFDLVLTDMTMPNMTGDLLAKAMKTIRADIPVVLCTGYSNKVSEENSDDLGIDAFAYKPMVKSELAKTVRRVLDNLKRGGEE